EITAQNTEMRFEKLFSINDNIFSITGSSGGIYFSNDNGNSWSAHNTGIKSVPINGLYASDSRIFVASEGGIFISSDGGINWNFMFLPYQLHSITSNSAGNLFLAAWGTLFKSTNDGNSWNEIYTGFNPWYTEIFIDDNDNIFLGGYDTGILKSTNDGINWSNIQGNLSDNTLASFYVSSKGTYFVKSWN